MSHLYGCDQRLNIYGVCSCDQIRQSEYKHALEAHTKALEDGNRINAEILDAKDQKIIKLEKEIEELKLEVKNFRSMMDAWKKLS